MSKNIHNTDLEQGRYGRTIVADGNVKTPPGELVFGAFKCQTAGRVASSTSASTEKNNVGSLADLTTLVAGDWYPERMQSFQGDGTLEGILYHEPF